MRSCFTAACRPPPAAPADGLPAPGLLRSAAAGLLHPPPGKGDITRLGLSPGPALYLAPVGDAGGPTPIPLSASCICCSAPAGCQGVLTVAGLLVSLPAAPNEPTVPSSSSALCAGVANCPPLLGLCCCGCCAGCCASSACSLLSRAAWAVTTCWLAARADCRRASCPWSAATAAVRVRPALPGSTSPSLVATPQVRPGGLSSRLLLVLPAPAASDGDARPLLAGRVGLLLPPGLPGAPLAPCKRPAPLLLVLLLAAGTGLPVLVGLV